MSRAGIHSENGAEEKKEQLGPGERRGFDLLQRPLASLAGCRLGTRKGQDSNSKPQYFESSVTPCSSGTEAVAVEGRRMSAGKVWSKALFDAGYFEGSKTVCYGTSRSQSMRGKFPDLLEKWRAQ